MPTIPPRSKLRIQPRYNTTVSWDRLLIKAALVGIHNPSPTDNTPHPTIWSWCDLATANHPSTSARHGVTFKKGNSVPQTRSQQFWGSACSKSLPDPKPGTLIFSRHRRQCRSITITITLPLKTPFPITNQAVQTKTKTQKQVRKRRTRALDEIGVKKHVYQMVCTNIALT